jgi:hypothetical protein
MLKNFFAGRWGIICVGAVIGILAGILQKMGNPGNMGICVDYNFPSEGCLMIERGFKRITPYYLPQVRRYPVS